MVSNLLIIREIFKADHNAAAARKLRRKQISALSGTLNNVILESELKLDKSFCTQKQSVPTACKVYVKF